MLSFICPTPCSPSLPFLPLGLSFIFSFLVPYFYHKFVQLKTAASFVT